MLDQEAETAAAAAVPDVLAMRAVLSDALAQGHVQRAREVLRVIVERVDIGADGVVEIRHRAQFAIGLDA
jgi:hypothetical protein